MDEATNDATDAEAASADDHRMFELEHLRSETTMFQRPEIPQTPSLPGQAQTPQPAIPAQPAVSPAAELPTAPAADQHSAPRTDVSPKVVAAAAIAMIAILLICYLVVRSL